MRFGDMDTTSWFSPAKKAAATGLAVAAFAVATVGSTGQAAAQGVCMPREKIVEMLDSRYTEAPVAQGLASGGRLIEVFSSPDGATWSLLLTAPDGTSCLMAEGHGWFSLPEALVGQVS